VKRFIVIGAALAALAVLAGAFGAHALEARLTAERLATWETAARYHMYGAIGLMLVGMIGTQYPAAKLDTAGWLMLAGVVIFGSTVYALALGGPRWLGAVTPLGGLSLIVAWVLTAVAVARDQRLTQ